MRLDCWVYKLNSEKEKEKETLKIIGEKNTKSMSTQSLSGQKMLVTSSLGLTKEMFSVTSFCFSNLKLNWERRNSFLGKTKLV